MGSLRSQFLIPLAATLILVCAVLAVVSWTMADYYARRSIRSRLQSVVNLCRAAPFPLTETVLRQMRDLSGVELVLLDASSLANGGTSPKNTVWTFPKNTDLLFESPAIEAIAAAADPSQELPLQSIRIGARRFDALVDQVRTGSTSNPSNRLVVLIDASERQRAAQQAFWMPALAGILSTVGLAFVATSIASRMVRRLERLERQVDSIATGNYDIAAVEGTPDDAIARLAKSVNKMSQQLERAQSEIVRAERFRMINLLGSGMAHQLRNSLGGAVLLLQTVLRRHASDKNYQEPDEELSMALNQLRLAEESIRRLMTMSKSGVHSTDRPMSIQAIHRSLEEYLGSLAEHHGVQLSWHSTPDDATRPAGQNTADQCVVQRGETTVGAILNLIINAIEAAGKGGRVECVYDPMLPTTSTPPSPALNVHRWRIRDNGPGPPSSIADQILEPFVTSKPEGVGLGLPTTARSAEQMGGSLTWTRRDAWTEFVFEIQEPPTP